MNMSPMQWINFASVALFAFAMWSGWSELFDAKTSSLVMSGLGLVVTILNMLKAVATGAPVPVPVPAPAPAPAPAPTAPTA